MSRTAKKPNRLLNTLVFRGPERKGGFAERRTLLWPEDTPIDEIARQVMAHDAAVYAIVDRQGRIYDIDSATYREGPNMTLVNMLTYYKESLEPNP